MTIIPDSIEPVVGWKSWDVAGDSTLRSPNYHLTWTPGEAADAACTREEVHATWVLKRITEIGPHDLTQPPQGVMNPFLSTGLSIAASFYIPPRPAVEPPPGYEYVLELEYSQHAAPVHVCTCGIYIANRIGLASGHGAIVGEVYGWGNVVQHSGGWRVQHAYPKTIYVPNEELVERLEAYGVPIVVGVPEGFYPAPDTAALSVGLRASKNDPISDVLLVCVIVAAIVNAGFFVLGPTVLGGAVSTIMLLTVAFLTALRFF